MEIIYEDRDIVVVNKPAGVFVHPAPGHEEESALSSLLLKRYPEMAGVGGRGREGVVHRLDAGTSGVMVFARNRAAYLALRRAFESHRDVEKVYLAVLHGSPREKQGTIETTIGRKSWDAHRMAVNAPGGKRAVTHWQVLSKKGGLALVEFRIETGRTHQIRLHAAHLGCPVVGDALYGDKARDRSLAQRPAHQLLHAVTLSFPHPKNGRRVSFSAPPPPELIYCAR